MWRRGNFYCRILINVEEMGNSESPSGKDHRNNHCTQDPLMARQHGSAVSPGTFPLELHYPGSRSLGLAGSAKGEQHRRLERGGEGCTPCSLLADRVCGSHALPVAAVLSWDPPNAQLSAESVQPLPCPQVQGGNDSHCCWSLAPRPRTSLPLSLSTPCEQSLS